MVLRGIRKLPEFYRFGERSRLFEICFRHLRFLDPTIKPPLVHTEHHKGLTDVVFKPIIRSV